MTQKLLKRGGNMLFLCYPGCATCRKARAFLDARGLEYDFRDIKLTNPTESELRIWQAKSGRPTNHFFNTSGLRYKELGLSSKLSGIGEDEKFRLLSSDGMLVKRPILVADDFALVGFRNEEWEEKL